MATLTIRNLDDALVNALKLRAQKHNRSLESEVRHILNDVAQRPTTEELVALANRIAAMTPSGVAQTDSGLLQREGRER